MVERLQDFTDTGSIELTEQEAERLTELMMHVRFSVSLKSARFNCDKNTTVIVGRLVQVSFLDVFLLFCPNLLHHFQNKKTHCYCQHMGGIITKHNMNETASHVDGIHMEKCVFSDVLP